MITTQFTFDIRKPTLRVMRWDDGDNLILDAVFEPKECIAMLNAVKKANRAKDGIGFHSVTTT